MSMKFSKADPAYPAKTPTVPKIALLLAAVMVVMALLQLFSFEKFVPLVESFGLPGGKSMAAIVACMIVIAEVFSLPFLLRMRLSPLMRIISMVCGWTALGGWFVLTIVINSIRPATDSMAFLGASIHLPVGWWASCYMLALLILMAWASWGMWPSTKDVVHKKA